VFILPRCVPSLYNQNKRSLSAEDCSMACVRSRPATKNHVIVIILCRYFQSIYEYSCVVFRKSCVQLLPLRQTTQNCTGLESLAGKCATENKLADLRYRLIYILRDVTRSVYSKVKVTLHQAAKAQRGSRYIVLLFKLGTIRGG